MPSNNFFAEMLLKRLGAAPGGQGTTRPAPRRRALTPAQLGSGVHAVDGSGLTRRNRASPTQVGQLLAGDARRARRPTSSSSRSPLAGHEGTVADRMEGTAAEGRCRTKTGTITGV